MDRRVAALAAVPFFALACASISGIDSYSVATCADGCDGSRAESGVDGAVGPDVDGAVGPDVDGADASPSCDAASCRAATFSAARWACSAGGCNSAGGACSGAGGCYCTRDSACASGKCVSVTGQNDVSCGSSCTGRGPADGFDCQLGSPGIPASCTITAFGYAPSNFSAAVYLAHVPSSATAIDCDLTYDSNSHSFSACAGACTAGFCSGATPPYIASNVAQTTPGGPSVDILVFAGLALGSGSTLTITNSADGGNAVVLAVYGDASIAGTIKVDGAAGGSNGHTNTNTPGASGPGGNYGCPFSSNAGQGLNGGPTTGNSGGGGGGASAAGGPGGPGDLSNAGAAGAARSNASLRPLYGGCPGGTSGGWGCTTYGGGGGGAVQISAAASLTVTGTITASGGAGGTSTCSAPGTCATYPGGGGGGGSGGAVLLEGQSVNSGTVLVNGGDGGDAQSGGTGGAGGTSASSTGKNGSGSVAGSCTGGIGGGGGGGGYGYLKVNGGLPSPSYTCTTSLAPTPSCNAARAACLCVADSDCSSGKCVNAHSQCSGSCSGSGAADVTDCQTVSAQTTSYACSTGNCSTVTSPAGACDAAGVACFCANDSECATGRCLDWAGCAPGACTGSGASDAFHCTLQ